MLEAKRDLLIVFTDVLSLMGTIPPQTRIFVIFSLTLTLKLGTCLEKIQVIKIESKKQLNNVIVTLKLETCLEKIQVIEKESKRQLNNVIVLLRKSLS